MIEIVAEISGNHGGSLHYAKELILRAKAAGADTVKFQCFEPAALAAKRVGVIWENKRMSFEDLLELYNTTHTPKSWFPELIYVCRRNGFHWFSSVFSASDVEFLQIHDCPRYKISAYEMLDHELIKAVVETGKPIIMSVRERPGLTIMHATDYQGKLIPIGISDHSTNGKWLLPSHDVKMVERHIRLEGVDTPDKEFSFTPSEFKDYVNQVRECR